MLEVERHAGQLRQVSVGGSGPEQGGTWTQGFVAHVKVLLFSLRETGRSQQGSEPSEKKRLERAGEESGRRTQVRFLECLSQDAIGSDGEK